MRVVVADDALLVRRGVVALLMDAGADVVGEADDVASLMSVVETTAPDVAVVDIRMPPTHTDEGVRAAAQLRRAHSDLGIVLLSQYIDVSLALRILERDERGMGYLLKDRVTEAGQLIDALDRVRSGGTVVDPVMVQGLVDRADRQLSVQHLLTFRELRVLSLIAEGHSDRSIATTLILSGKTVEAHITRIFRKLELAVSPSANRRVHAVLRYLRELEREPILPSLDQGSVSDETPPELRRCRSSVTGRLIALRSYGPVTARCPAVGERRPSHRDGGCRSRRRRAR